MNMKHEIAEALASLELMNTFSVADIEGMLEYPPTDDKGDVALPCFKLSKTLHKAPPKIAADLLSAVEAAKPASVSNIQVVGGYLNFFMNKAFFAERVLSEALQPGFGSNGEGEGKTVCIDYSSPNIAKPFHIGHLRSTVIGAALYRIFEYNGYKCVGINHLGDWGTQFGKMIIAYKLWGDDEIIKRDGTAELVKLYVRFHTEAETNPELDEQAREAFAALERGDAEYYKLWKRLTDMSIEALDMIYARLGVTFDSYAGESFYNDKMAPVVQELKDKNLLKESNGAMIVEFPDESMPPCLILKSSGATLYATRDITAALYRKKTYNFDKCIYITGNDQKLHFRQWFRVINMMGYEWSKDLYHLGFGLVSLPEGKLSTRKGHVVLMDDVMNEAVTKARAIIEEKHTQLENKDEVAEALGIGAIIFHDLHSNMIKDITFSWDEILNYDGETGPYVQYTHARCCTLMAKAEGTDTAVKSYELTAPQELAVIKQLNLFGEKLALSMHEMEPSVLTRYLVELCKSFNSFYNACPILTADDNVKGMRLMIVRAVETTLKTGLALLGLKAPERV